MEGTAAYASAYVIGTAVGLGTCVAIENQEHRPLTHQDDAVSMMPSATAAVVAAGVAAVNIDAVMDLPELLGCWPNEHVSGSRKHANQAIRRLVSAAKSTGDDCLRSHNFEDAASHYTSAITAGCSSMSPSQLSVLYCNRSAALLALGQLGRSFGDAEAALSLRPKYERAWMQKAAALQAMAQSVLRTEAAQEWIVVGTPLNFETKEERHAISQYESTYGHIQTASRPHPLGAARRPKTPQKTVHEGQVIETRSEKEAALVLEAVAAMEKMLLQALWDFRESTSFSDVEKTILEQLARERCVSHRFSRMYGRVVTPLQPSVENWGPQDPELEGEATKGMPAAADAPVVDAGAVAVEAPTTASELPGCSSEKHAAFKLSVESAAAAAFERNQMLVRQALAASAASPHTCLGRRTLQPPPPLPFALGAPAQGVASLSEDAKTSSSPAHLPPFCNTISVVGQEMDHAQQRTDSTGTATTTRETTAAETASPMAPNAAEAAAVTAAAATRILEAEIASGKLKSLDLEKLAIEAWECSTTKGGGSMGQRLSSWMKL